MEGSFFEGKDFAKGEFKALIPKYYPQKYKKYIQEETKFLRQKIRGQNRVLEAGVGIGRLIPVLAPLIKEFVGIDKAKLMVKKSKEVAKKYQNVRIVEGKLEKLNKIFSKDYFDFSLCVWNTLGNVQNEVGILKKISGVTKKSIFVTVYKKGTIKKRKEWYEKVGVSIRRIDTKKEIFYSKSGLKSKSYNLKDLRIIAKKSGLKIKQSKVLGGVILLVELIK